MKRLKELRIQRGLTQTQVGDLIGVSCVTIARYEAGDREPSNAKITTLADYFGVTVDYLMGRDEPATAQPAPTDPRREKAHRLLDEMDEQALDGLIAMLDSLQKKHK